MVTTRFNASLVWISSSAWPSDSLPSGEVSATSKQPKLYHVSFRGAISRSNLGYARPCMPWTPRPSISCLSLFPWGKFRRRKSAVKLHTLLDLQGSIPTNVYVTGGQVHDVNVLDVGLLETKLFCGPSAIPIPCGASTIAMPRRIPD